MINTYYQKYQPDVDRFKIVSSTITTSPSGIPNSEWIFAKKYAAEVLSRVYQYL